MSSKANRGFLCLVLVLVAAGILATAGIQQGWFDRGPVALPNIERQTDAEKELAAMAPQVTRQPLSAALGVAEQDMVEVGGVQRPKRDLDFAAKSDEAVSDEPTKSLFPHAGNAPAIPKDANVQVAGLYEELAQVEPPLAARSSLFPPEPFDQVAYDADKQAWLDKIRPGRAFEPAQPGPDVVPIATPSQAFQNVVQGDKVILEAKVSPGSMVTFYTPAVGEFDNRLTTHSVAADDAGIAKTVYTAGPGTLGLIDIVAASPVHSGQLRFKVRVSLPE